MVEAHLLSSTCRQQFIVSTADQQMRTFSMLTEELLRKLISDVETYDELDAMQTDI